MTRSARRWHLRATLVAVAALGAAQLAFSAPAGSAGLDHAPTAPAHLTVDDRADPLAVQGIPQFGWLPRDPDGNEIQTAYQIVVTRAGQRQPVWDSGKVVSSAESWVPYGGPAPPPPAAAPPGGR